MAKCAQCGTHLWVGSQECPTCDPVPFNAPAPSRAATEEATKAAKATKKAEAVKEPAPRPDAPADPRRWLATALVVAFLPVGVVAWYSANRVGRANEQQDFGRSHAWSRRVLHCAVAVPALWLLAWGVVPGLLGANGERAAVTTDQGGGEVTPSVALLASDLEELGLTKAEADCLAAAVVGDLDATAWELAGSHPASPALQDRVAHLAGGC